MRIETPDGAYRVIRVCKKELSVCSYLAVDAESGEEKVSGRRFLLLEFRNPILAKDMMLHFMEMKGADDGREDERSGAFPDFEDCFVREKTVWAVFRYHEGISFRDAAAQAASYKERMLLWERLLDRLFLQKMPSYLRYEAANPANIVVDEESAVWVNYELYETDRLHDDLFYGLQRRLYDSFCLILGADRKSYAKKSGGDSLACGADSVNRAETVCDAESAAEGSFEDEMTLYRNFQELSALVSAEEDGGKKDRDRKDNGAVLRLWRFVLRHTGAIVKCGYWVLVLALWGLFFWLCFCPKTAPKERHRISVIGTVNVETMEQEEE